MAVGYVENMCFNEQKQSYYKMFLKPYSIYLLKLLLKYSKMNDDIQIIYDLLTINIIPSSLLSRIKKFNRPHMAPGL